MSFGGLRPSENRGQDGSAWAGVQREREREVPFSHECTATKGEEMKGKGGIVCNGQGLWPCAAPKTLACGGGSRPPGPAEGAGGGCPPHIKPRPPSDALPHQVATHRPVARARDQHVPLPCGGPAGPPERAASLRPAPQPWSWATFDKGGYTQQPSVTIPRTLRKHDTKSSNKKNRK